MMEGVFMTARDLGRHVYGAAAVFFGLVSFAWHDYDDWHRLQSLWHVPVGPALIYLTSAAQVFGGIAIQFRKGVRIGAAVLAVTYALFTLLWVPQIARAPLVYDNWGNLFEQLSLVSGAAVLYGLGNVGRVLFGLCVVSFTLEQALYLSGTASFVPKWIPPSQMFWAVATTIAFALAAIAILSGLAARLASRLSTLMIVLFGLLIWIPQLVLNPNDHENWAGVAENFAIAGAAWIVSDFLSALRAPRNLSRP
jgi:uncharacterized membrane protein YphA (DoxX/SURF4 family)